MARRKNVKRIDPRYFLNETVDRNDNGSVLDEQSGVDPKFDPAHLQKLGMVEWQPSPEAGQDMQAGSHSPGMAADNNGVLLVVANPTPGSLKRRMNSYWVHHSTVGVLQRHLPDWGRVNRDLIIPKEAVADADKAFG
jgi:hypothetical protein